MYTVVYKIHHPYYFSNNSDQNRLILVVIGSPIPTDICNIWRYLCPHTMSMSYRLLNKKFSVYGLSRKRETKSIFYITLTNSHALLQFLASNFSNVLGNYYDNECPPVQLLYLAKWIGRHTAISQGHNGQYAKIALENQAELFTSPTCATKITNNITRKVREGIQNVHHRPWCTSIGYNAIDEWLVQWRDPAWPTLFSASVSVLLDHWRVFCTPSLAVFPTSCNQLDSNLVNLEATVEIRWILEFLSLNNSVVACVWRAFEVSHDDWVRLNVPPTHYRSYGDGFLRVKWPNQQCQSTEGR